jgi:hypothetical protein
MTNPTQPQWVERLTSYPCGFAIADLAFGGAVELRFSGITGAWSMRPACTYSACRSCAAAR